jgi:AcrR family transcriptional regulator
MTIADRKEREFKRREEEILAAAYKLFMKYGLEAVTIEMIAEAAEIGKGTIYKHFRSKHDIFASLAINAASATLATFQEQINPDGPVIDQFRRMIRIVWDKFIDNPEQYYLLNKCERIVATQNLTPEIAEKVMAKHNVTMALVEKLFSRGIKEGIIRDEPIENLYTVGYGVIAGTIDIMQDTKVEDPEKLYELMENVIIKGMMRY